MGLTCQTPASSGSSAFRGFILTPATFSVPNNAGTPVTWASALKDTDGFFDGSTPDRVTLTVVGYYLLLARVRFPNSTAGERDAFITDPTTTGDYGRDSGSEGAGGLLRGYHLDPSGIIYNSLTTSQVVLELYQSSGAAMTVGAYFQGQYLGS